MHPRPGALTPTSARARRTTGPCPATQSRSWLMPTPTRREHRPRATNAGTVDRFPRAVPLGHIPPGSTSAGAPAYERPDNDTSKSTPSQRKQRVSSITGKVHGDRAVAREAIDSALHRVALSVVGRVELRWPAAVGTAFPAVGDLVAFLSCSGYRDCAGRRGSCGSRTPCRREPCPVGCAGDPARAGHPERSRTTLNCGESLRCPAVTISDIGFWACDRQVELRRHRERPSPWSSGSVNTPPGGSTHEGCLAAS